MAGGNDFAHAGEADRGFGWRDGCEIETVVGGEELVEEERALFEGNRVEKSWINGLTPMLDGCDAFGF